MIHLLLALQLSTTPIQLTTGNSVVKTEDKVELSELSKVKAELFQTKIQLIQAQQEIQKLNLEKLNSQLVAEQTDLVNTFRKELKASDSETWDWQTLTFKPKQEEKK